MSTLPERLFFGPPQPASRAHKPAAAGRMIRVFIFSRFIQVMITFSYNLQNYRFISKRQKKLWNFLNHFLNQTDVFPSHISLVIGQYRERKG